MKKNVVVISAVTLLLAMPGLSSAQLGNLLGGKTAGSASGAELGAQQDQLVKNYLGAGKEVLVASGHMSQALGLKAQAVNAAATSDSLSAKDVEAQDKAISAEAEAVSEAMKKGVTLKDAEAKATYAKGLASLAIGVKKYMALRGDAQSFTSGLSGANPLQLGKLQAGAYVAKTLPTSVSNVTKVLKSAVDFAKSNGVAVPKDATSLL